MSKIIDVDYWKRGTTPNNNQPTPVSSNYKSKKHIHILYIYIYEQACGMKPFLAMHVVAVINVKEIR